MMRRLGMICLFLGAVLCGGTAAAQHTLGVTGGYGNHYVIGKRHVGIIEC